MKFLSKKMKNGLCMSHVDVYTLKQKEIFFLIDVIV